MLFFSDNTPAVTCVSIGPVGHCVRLGIAVPVPPTFRNDY